MENEKKTLAAFICRKAADEALAATIGASDLLCAAIRENDRKTADAIAQTIKDVRERAGSLYASANSMIEYPERDAAERSCFFLLNRTIEATRLMMENLLNAPQRSLNKQYEKTIKRVELSYGSISLAPRTMDDLAFNCWNGSYAKKVRDAYERINKEDDENESV